MEIHQNISKEDIRRVCDIYQNTLSLMDQALIGQENAKKIIVTSLLCDTNSKLLLTGGTGFGKTTITRFLASSFNHEKLSITVDTIPVDVQEQLKKNPNMKFLWVDEFNRANGKTQSVFLELFADKEITIDGETHEFGDFYVVATQNEADFSGIFDVPLAVYDRFDVRVPFKALNKDEMQSILFGDFKPSKKCHISEEDLLYTKRLVDNFQIEDRTQKALLAIFMTISSMEYEGKPLFAGSNVRGNIFILKLAKLSALAHGRNYILPADIAVFVDDVYRHRINQNVAGIEDKEVVEKFENVKDKILQINKKYFIK